jgi:hypothetical protein
VTNGAGTNGAGTTGAGTTGAVRQSGSKLWHAWPGPLGWVQPTTRYGAERLGGSL